MNGYNVAILGATGAVGNRMIVQLEKSDIKVNSLKLLASKKSVGKKLLFKNEELIVEEASPKSFENIDLVFSSAGGEVAKQLLPEAVKRGAICVDNSSAFRMQENVPLVVPEVNANELANHNGIIANPNCSTIQMVVALNPVFKKYGLKRIIVSTYQAAGGAGQKALDELNEQAQEILNGQKPTANVLPVASEKKHYPLAFNLIPQIDVFEDDGYSFEEWKMINETKKILLGGKDKKGLAISATCVRVPVGIGHGESVYFEVENNNINLSVDDIKQLISNGQGIILKDNPKKQEYPMPIDVVDKRETFVGRIRKDIDVKEGFHMWIVADNLIKGAAGNAIQIGEKLIENNLI